MEAGEGTRTLHQPAHSRTDRGGDSSGGDGSGGINIGISAQIGVGIEVGMGVGMGVDSSHPLQVPMLVGGEVSIGMQSVPLMHTLHALQQAAIIPLESTANGVHAGHSVPPFSMGEMVFASPPPPARIEPTAPPEYLQPPQSSVFGPPPPHPP